jgi:hypothetical protein
VKKNTLGFLLTLTVLVLLINIGFSVAAATPNAAKDLSAKAPRTMDDQFHEVAEKAPEFGGMFLEDDVLKVYLVNPEKKSAAEAAIASVFGRERIPRGGIQVLQGQYSFAQLEEWHNRMGGLFDIEGVVFTDADERSNRLKVGVKSSDLSGQVEKELKRQGIPRDAFIIEQTEPVEFMSTLRDKVRPLQGGLQIAFTNNPSYYNICTLGFNGIGLGNNGFVVNSHCTYNQGAVDNAVYYQPTPAAANRIGTEIADPSFASEKCPTGMTGVICRWSDSAYAKLDSNINANIGSIERPYYLNSRTIAGSFRITSEGFSSVGQIVNKVGRTTGWTQGKVTNTCINVGVAGTNIVLRCQDGVSARLGGGDSGSPVFSITNSPNRNDVQLRGILWGGNQEGTWFVYSPVSNINYELGPITKCASGFSC